MTKHKQWVRLTGGYITTTAGPDWADHVIAEVRDESAADLLTAAPELLAALEAARDVLEVAKNYFPKSIQNADRFALLNALANAVEPAIAKARGVTP